MNGPRWTKSGSGINSFPDMTINTQQATILFQTQSLTTDKDHDMQGKTFTTRLNQLAIITFGTLIVFLAVFSKFPDPKPAPTLTNNDSNIGVAYPSSTNICISGCNAHQNWISFYLISNTYIEKSLRLKTSLFWGKLLTYGISSTPCLDQIKPGYTCINMDISHRLLSLLTGLNLTPLDQLRNNSNWWLEYAIAGQIDQ